MKATDNDAQVRDRSGMAGRSCSSREEIDRFGGEKWGTVDEDGRARSRRRLLSRDSTGGCPGGIPPTFLLPRPILRLTAHTVTNAIG